jgi:hypothetical protein
MPELPLGPKKEFLEDYENFIVKYAPHHITIEVIDLHLSIDLFPRKMNPSSQKFRINFCVDSIVAYHLYGKYFVFIILF